MTPLNQPERRTRLWQFSLLYLVALLIPLVASYYLFSNTSLAAENARLKAELDRTKEEQTRLVVDFDTLTGRLKRIDAVDLRMRTEPNDLLLGQLTTTNQNNLNGIVFGMDELRNDSTRMQTPAHRQLARNILRDLELFRSNRNTIELLRQDLTKRGDAAKGTERLAEELSQAKQQIVLLQASLSRPAPAAAAAPAPAPAAHKAKGGAAATPSVSALFEIASLKDKIAFTEADCLRQRGFDFKSGSKERKQLLEQSRTALLQLRENSSTTDMKQDVEKTIEGINTELGRPARFFGLF